MRGKRVLVLATLALTMVAAVGEEPANSGESSSAETAKVIVFPVIADAPAKTSAEQMKENELAYVQSLRSPKAVRLTSDYSFAFKTVRLAKFPDNRSATLKQGSMLVVALGKSGEMYCAATASEPDDFWNFYDTGICFRDTDKDGKFDQQLIVNQRPWRVRVPYEINQTGDRTWQSVSIPYEQIPTADIPVLELRVRYAVRHSLLEMNNLSFIVGEICWPAALVTPVNSLYVQKPCAEYDGLIEGNRTLISDRKNTQGTLSAPTLTVHYGRRADAALRVDVTTTLQSGPALLATVARMYKAPGDGRDQVSVERLMPLRLAPISPQE